jgi:hypothetical protein
LCPRRPVDVASTGRVPVSEPNRHVDRDHGVERQRTEHNGEVVAHGGLPIVDDDPSGATSVDTRYGRHRSRLGTAQLGACSLGLNVGFGGH